MRKMFRQGDVLLVSREKVFKKDRKDRKDPRGMVLAEGETSGHHHAVFANRNASLFDFSEEGIAKLGLEIDSAGALIKVVGGEVGGVPRHEPIQIPGGTYEVRIQKAWDSSFVRRVVD